MEDKITAENGTEENVTSQKWAWKNISCTHTNIHVGKCTGIYMGESVNRQKCAQKKKQTEENMLRGKTIRYISCQMYLAENVWQWQGKLDLEI